MLVRPGILLLSKISLDECTCIVVVVLLIPPGHIKTVGSYWPGIFDISLAPPLPLRACTEPSFLDNTTSILHPSQCLLVLIVPVSATRVA